MRIRSFFEQWSAAINSHEGNVSTLFRPETSGSGYMADLYVKQLEKDSTTSGNVVRRDEWISDFGSGSGKHLIFEAQYVTVS